VIENKSQPNQNVKIFVNTCNECEVKGLNIAITWDIFKTKVKEYTIGFCSIKNDENKKKIMDIEKELLDNISVKTFYSCASFYVNLYLMFVKMYYQMIIKSFMKEV
jgi:hypothetical protein